MSISSFFSGLVNGAGNIEHTVEREIVSAADLIASTQLYGIVKGIAEVAVMADPALGVAVNSAIAVLDLLMADVKSDSATAAASVPALKSAASDLLVQTASAVTVTPNKV